MSHWIDFIEPLETSNKERFTMKRTTIFLAAFAYLVVAITAPTQAKTSAVKPSPQKTEYTCPVTGDKVVDITTAQKSVYKGKTYYFCCQGCKPMFDKNPQKYIKEAAAQSKPTPKAKAKPTAVICPVMGKTVTDLKHAPKSVYKGKTYYFCCQGCKPMFDKNPEKYIKPPKKH
jgi:YHS domain-containing protein